MRIRFYASVYVWFWLYDIPSHGHSQIHSLLSFPLPQSLPCLSFPSKMDKVDNSPSLSLSDSPLSPRNYDSSLQFEKNLQLVNYVVSANYVRKSPSQMDIKFDYEFYFRAK